MRQLNLTPFRAENSTGSLKIPAVCWALGDGEGSQKRAAERPSALQTIAQSDPLSPPVKQQGKRDEHLPSEPLLTAAALPPWAPAEAFTGGVSPRAHRAGQDALAPGRGVPSAGSAACRIPSRGRQQHTKLQSCNLQLQCAVSALPSLKPKQLSPNTSPREKRGLSLAA